MRKNHTQPFEPEPESLPLLEHVLSLLYDQQSTRGDGLLRWSDYRELGELKGALAKHAEAVFSTLSVKEQRAFPLVMRHLESEDVSGLAGLSQRSPILAATMTLAMVSLVVPSSLPTAISFSCGWLRSTQAIAICASVWPRCWRN